MYTADIQTSSGTQTFPLDSRTLEHARERATTLARREWKPDYGDAFKVRVVIFENGKEAEEFKILVQK